jgi:hypothetical protein
MQGKGAAAGVYAILVALAGGVVFFPVTVSIHLVHALNRAGDKAGEDRPRQAGQGCKQYR